MSKTTLVIAALLALAIAPCLGARGAMKAVKAAGGTDQVTIPQLLNYQGKLTDTAGRPVPNGLYAVTFNMYPQDTGGTAFWTEVQNVQTRSGLFNVQLGAVTPMTYVPWDGNCWLEMQVHPDPAMTPRVRIVSAGYSYFSAVAETAMAAGKAAAARPLVPGVDSAEIAANAVTSIGIKDHTITGNDIAAPCSLVTQVGNPRAAIMIRALNTGNGIRIDSADNYGIVVHGTVNEGLVVWSTHANGIYAYHVPDWGVRGSGALGGGYFQAESAKGIAVTATSYNSVAADTAIRAYGKGLASGGWSTGLDGDVEAPCVVALDRMIVASGTATLSDSKVSVRFPDAFIRNIKPGAPVRVNLTARGNPAGILCLGESDESGFQASLKTVPGWDGTNNVTFDWTAFGTLREPSGAPGPKPPSERTVVRREP